jgi:hypothetical protein
MKTEISERWGGGKVDEKSVVILYNTSIIIYFQCPSSLSTNSQTFIYQNKSNVQLMDYQKAKLKFTPIHELYKENESPWYDTIDLYQ